MGTGLRVSECVGLDIDDVDFDVNGVRVLRKGSKEMIVYFGEEVEIALKDYLVQRKAIETAPNMKSLVFINAEKEDRRKSCRKLVKNTHHRLQHLKDFST